MVFLRTHRTSVVLPASVIYTTGERNPNFAAETEQLVRLLRDRGGYLVSYGFLTPPGFISTATLASQLQLDVIATNGLNVLYYAQPARARAPNTGIEK